MTGMTGPDCAVMCNLINTHAHTHTHPWDEDQCEWHRMTRMTGPDCAVMCNLLNTHTHTHTHDNGNENRIGEGGRRRKSARNRKIAVDAVRETGRQGWKAKKM